MGNPGALLDITLSKIEKLKCKYNSMVKFKETLVALQFSGRAEFSTALRPIVFLGFNCFRFCEDFC